MTLRYAIRLTHRWVGLASALFLVLIAVSGSLLVYRDALNRLLAPELFVVSPGASRVSAEAMVAAAAGAAGDARPVRLLLPARDDGAAAVQLSSARMVMVDPWTGRVLGIRQFEREFLGRMGGFHATLLAGRPGGVLVGLIGLLLLFEVITGVIRWWPSKVLWPRRGGAAKRLVFELHNSSGSWAAPFVLINTVTGVLISFGVLADRFVSRIEAAPSEPAVTVVVRDTPRVVIDSVLAAAAREVGAPAQSVSLPQRPDRPFVVFTNWPGVHTRETGVRVLVDPYSGAVAAVAAAARRGGFRSAWAEWRIGLHSGEIAGMPGRVVTFLLGPLLLLQAATGVLYWWQTRRTAEARSG